jgi:hypothetical protein
MLSESGIDSSNNPEAQSAPKIGKLRIHKSGKVVMRIQLPGEKTFVDLELNMGI